MKKNAVIYDTRELNGLLQPGVELSNREDQEKKCWIWLWKHGTIFKVEFSKIWVTREEKVTFQL